MKAPPKQPLLLNQILFAFGSSAIILSAKTGIPVKRLEQMFALANSTEAELQLVAEALERPVEAIKQAFNYQAGIFNQNGSNQRQRVNTKEKRLTVKVKQLQVIIQVTSPIAKPQAEDPNALVERTQQWDDSYALPGGQASQIGRSLTSGTHGF